MDWHPRYIQQANWTRALREYLFKRTGLRTARRVLEVGCGTGAILGAIEIITPQLHGLDIRPATLMEARVHAPNASLTCGDSLSLPYHGNCFDIVFCHFLLLWVSDPERALLEMKRVAREGGHILALAEPDYGGRVDKPAELAVLGHWQSESLQRQGADPSLGGKLAELFYKAGIELIETGAIESREKDSPTSTEQELEWAVLENDLAEFVPEKEIHRLKKLDEEAWRRGERILHVPTYFAWGRI
ncbi:MAG: class I SAM-dependent methyltransferase [Anaerolineales bacterium]|jgi:SAM-dependent methyltransferase